MHAHKNPFRSERVEALPFQANGHSIKDLLLQLDRQHGRGSLVGPTGSGKTTLMLALNHELQARGIPTLQIRLSTERRRLDLGAIRDASPSRALLLDGAEQLPLPIWWWLRWHARKRPYLITTSHRRAHLPLLHAHTTSPRLLGELIAQLVGSAPPLAELERRHRRHAGNIRNGLRELYDEYSHSDDTL
jgi:energy-coupling factor transporter ATP-binding protein EcfA2